MRHLLLLCTLALLACASETDGPPEPATCESFTGICKQGDSQVCFYKPPLQASQSCLCDPTTCECSWDTCPGTPLVLVFDDAPVAFEPDGVGSFDLGQGVERETDWPTARTPWLALDRDGDGRITSGAELFGSMTSLSDGRRARHGFEALRELDTDGNGRIDAADAAFSELVIWSDIDADRRSAPGELTAARELIAWIDLAYTSDPRCDARGNCEVERARFGYVGASDSLRTGWVVDVHLPTQGR